MLNQCYKKYLANPNESLKTQLLKSFVSLTIGFMSIALFMLLIAVVLGNNYVIDSSVDALYSQIIRHANSVSAENGAMLERITDRARQSVSTTLSFAIGETYRPDYSYGEIESYFEYGNTYLKEPLTQDSRQSIPVSLGASSFYFPGSNSTTIYDSAQEQARDLTAHCDTFFKKSYENNIDFVAEYYGASTTSMLRSYPGISTLSTDPTRLYDPTVRPWYLSAIETPGDTAITSPYLDFNGKGWMITLSRTVVNASSGEFIGVVGGDMLIESLNQQLEDISFLTTGKVSLFENKTTGLVVADKEWPLDPNDSEVYTYETLQEPPVPRNTWDKISSVPVGNTDTIEYDANGDIYLAIATNLDDRYIMVIFVKKEEITKPVEPIINDINTKKATVIAIIVVISLFLMCITISLVYHTTKSIIKPLDDAMKQFNKVGMNLGSADYTAGLDDIDGGIGDEEIEFVRGTNAMIHHLQESRQEQIDASQIDNVYYGPNNQNGFLNAIPMTQLYPVSAPSNMFQQQQHYQHSNNNNDYSQIPVVEEMPSNNNHNPTAYHKYSAVAPSDK
jgi:hypothetical protein